MVSYGARRRRLQRKGEEGGVAASTSARGWKPARSSAGRKGITCVGGGEKRQTRQGREGKGKGADGEGGRRAVAGEEYPVGRLYGDGRRRFCRREEEGEKGEKNKEDKEKKEREEKISRKIETENGFRLNLKTKSKYRLYLETEKKKFLLYF